MGVRVSVKDGNNRPVKGVSVHARTNEGSISETTNGSGEIDLTFNDLEIYSVQVAGQNVWSGRRRLSYSDDPLEVILR